MVSISSVGVSVGASAGADVTVGGTGEGLAMEVELEPEVEFAAGASSGPTAQAMLPKMTAVLASNNRTIRLFMILLCEKMLEMFMKRDCPLDGIKFQAMTTGIDIKSGVFGHIGLVNLNISIALSDNEHNMLSVPFTAFLKSITRRLSHFSM
jgi:hypothetical protein